MPHEVPVTMFHKVNLTRNPIVLPHPPEPVPSLLLRSGVEHVADVGGTGSERHHGPSAGPKSV